MKCTDHCLSCSSKDDCELCDDAYFLSDDNKCTACNDTLHYCIRCENAEACEECKENAFFVPGSVTCELCENLVENCAICEDYQTCATCQSGYDFKDGKCESGSDIVAILIVAIALGVAIVLGVGTC